MRKQIHLEAKGALTPRERIWAAVRVLKKFTLSEISRRAKVETVDGYAKALERAGYIRRSGRVAVGKRSARTEVQFELLRDVGIEAPRLKADGSPSFNGISREQMWRTMKILHQFTSTDLAVQASTEEHPVAENDARGYLHFLAKAGYVHPVAAADPSIGSKTLYAFVRSKNTGPKPPMIQQVKQVYDRNLGKVVYAPDPQEIEE